MCTQRNMDAVSAFDYMWITAVFSRLFILRKIPPVSLDGLEFFHGSSESAMWFPKIVVFKNVLCPANPCPKTTAKNAVHFVAGDPIGNFPFGHPCHVHIPLVSCLYKLEDVNNLI